ncbi:MAG: carboxypeptidase-like regulatory domain-containing protein [Fermentimonas sp.]|nr:carboxypeptidase-like regulatory domain-containing protein [Fermentimonas sp.]
MKQITVHYGTRLILFLLFLLIGGRIESFAGKPISVEFRENSQTGQMVSHVLKVTNYSGEHFKGEVKVDSPEGIRCLSRDDRSINLKPGDSIFVSYKLILTKNLNSGEKKISYNLLNDVGVNVDSCATLLQIEEREQLIMMVNNAPTLLSNPDDSVRINVTMQNNGNVTEEVYLVFNVPNLQGSPPFTELKAVLSPGEQRNFTHSFLVSSNLLAAERFPVRITALKGRDKQIVETRTVNVNSIITNRSYNTFLRDQAYSAGQGSLNNGVQLSYRTYNFISQTMQLQGGTYLDLPAGYLHLKGNIYKYNSQYLPYVSNTSLTYQINENQLMFGNVQEQTELSLYGRGVKALFSDKEGGRMITIGAIDQNYNLIDDSPWFKDYYSYFVNGQLGGVNEQSGLGATYVYQKNPYEKAIFHLGSLEWKHRFNHHWSMELAAHGTSGSYSELGENHYSGAAEMSYSGRIKEKILLNGSAYYSDPYFPGNRKGILSLMQNGSFRITDEINLNLSYSYNRSEPKSYSYDYSYSSQNQNGNISLSLPSFRNIHTSLNYQQQMESSSSYSYLVGSGVEGDILNMNSHRMGWQWRWQNPAWKYSFFGTIEGGFFKNPINKQLITQGKASLSFSYRWLSMAASWQQGAYYLFEHVMAQRQDKAFTRFTASASVNHQVSNKLRISSGINFSNDVYQGDIPSININAIYTPRSKVSLFLTGSWYKYPNQGNREILNIEGGVRYSFSGGVPLKGRKSSLIAKVYYDNNANGSYDMGDAPAEGYLVEIDRKAFISGEKGEVKYTSVPFGNYEVKQMQAGEWSFDQQEVVVNRYKTKIDIPLRQSGTLQGSIRYIVSENSIEIKQRYEGFRFTVTSSDGKLRQTVVTDGQGNFITFLPTGEYSITLDQKTLPEHTECKEPVQNFTIEGGETCKLKPFDIEVRTRQLKVKKFFAQKQS